MNGNHVIERPSAGGFSILSNFSSKSVRIGRLWLYATRLPFGILLGLSGCFFIATLSGCTSSTEKFNKDMARQEYNTAHNECWKLFSRIDPEKKKEYQDCMKKKGWLIT